MPLVGGAPTIFATGQNEPIQIVADGASVFWVNNGTMQIDCRPPDGQIVKAPVGGGKPVVLASNVVGVAYLSVASGTAYFSAVGNRCDGFDLAEGIVAKVPPDGGPPTPLATAQFSPGAIVINGPCLYYTTTTGETTAGAVLAVAD